jgi:microcystin-dependent protein
MSESLTGEIQVFGFNFPPYGWSLCNGNIYPISQNSALFALLGATYGGNGSSTFAIPDLRSRVAINQGQGPGLSYRELGERAGTESHTMTYSEMPIHTHVLSGGGTTFMASSQPATQPAPSNTVNTIAAFNDPAFAAINNVYNGVTPDVALNGFSNLSGTIGVTGNGQSFSMMQPTLGLNYSICLYGVFPARN